MDSLKGLGLEFEETMSGWIGIGEADFLAGRIAGQQENTPLHFDCQIIIDDLQEFIHLADHQARLEGMLTFPSLGGPFSMKNGSFNLFSVDPDTGMRLMTYSFGFTTDTGKRYFLYGEKHLKADPGFDLIEDMTTLFTTIYEGPDENAPVYGAGQLFFDLKDVPALMNSFKVIGTRWWELHRRIQAKVAFMDFAWGKVREEYLRDVDPLYTTEYENLVLSGRLQQDGEEQDFFLVSGIHDKDFPWGDGEIFWDVLLVIGNEASGYKKYCLTDRILTGLYLNVQDGTYRYQGPIYEITEGYATRFSHLKAKKSYLKECQADFTINFQAQPYAVTPLPFAIANHVLANLTSGLKWVLRNILPSEHVLGIFITPHTVTVNTGTLRISRGEQTASYQIVTEATFGEAERSTFKNIKQPTLLYGYICALRPEANSARVQIHANSLRNERQRLVKDQVDALLGAVVSRVASKEYLMAEGTLQVQNLGPKGEISERHPPLFVKQGNPILEVNNDHFPTADFQRRIIAVQDPSGEVCLALEEDMDFMRLGAENSTREVTVAAIRHDNRYIALDEVLNKTAFFNLLNDACEASGKAKPDFAIVIKPNFMFAYNKADQTTFTDPSLVERLVEALRQEGFTNIAVVEAQSTYGEYFYNRRVREVAEYLGFTMDGSRGYQVVDLTEDQYEERYLGPHLGQHRVPLTWRDADFRISFAKNKTHAYSYYTLTLKNIYGALPLSDKFSEYHTGRGIYHTTIEYLRAYPVHYGLIDASFSADGPFGIFADPEPNITETIIGGDDLVAVDWVGASKMGLEPKISQYMELAVQAFGKPEITLIGDRNPYRPWLNVPAVLSLFTHYGLDANDYFGNLLYMAGAYMDETQFPHKSKDVFMRKARKAIKYLQEAIFLQAGGERTEANRLVSRFFTWLGSQ